MRECNGFRTNVRAAHAGVIAITGGGTAISLDPSTAGFYPHVSTHPEQLPAADEVVEASAAGSTDVPAFKLATTFPRKVRVVLPGQEAEDGSRTLFGGAIRGGVDLDIPIEPPENAVEVSLTGVARTCAVSGPCLLVTSCAFARAPVIIPGEAIRAFASDQRVNVVVAAANRTHTKAGTYDLDLVAYGARWPIDFMMQ
jgi:hypothetical protein